GRFVNEHPVRPSRFGPQFLNPSDERFKQLRTVLQTNTGQIHHRVLVYFSEDVQHFLYSWRPLVITERDSTFQSGIIALRVNNQKLKLQIGEPLEQCRRKSGLPRSRASADKNVRTVWLDREFGSVRLIAQDQFVM